MFILLASKRVCHFYLTGGDWSLGAWHLVQQVYVGLMRVVHVFDIVFFFFITIFQWRVTTGHVAHIVFFLFFVIIFGVVTGNVKGVGDVDAEVDRPQEIISNQFGWLGTTEHFHACQNISEGIVPPVHRRRFASPKFINCPIHVDQKRMTSCTPFSVAKFNPPTKRR